MENPSFLSGESQKIRQSVVPIVKPVARAVIGLSLFARINVLLQRHVLFASDTKVTFYRTTAHRTTVQFSKTRRAYTSVPARQQSPRQWKVLTDHAQLFPSCVPKGTFAVAATGRYQGTSGTATGAVARFRQCQCRTQTRRNIPFVVIR